MSNLYIFKDASLLKMALTHPSATKTDRTKSYERLEFLGDKLIGMLVANMIWKRYPEASEAQLSIMHANLVNTKTMSSVAKLLKLNDVIIMDKGEEFKGGRENLNILEDTMEAYAAAVYLDSDLDTLTTIIEDAWNSFVDNANLIQERDAKSVLQEVAQKMSKPIPTYTVVNTEGSAHSPLFTINVHVDGFEAVRAVGKTKKDAQQAAAKLMLQKINEQKVE